MIGILIHRGYTFIWKQETMVFSFAYRCMTNLLFSDAARGRHLWSLTARSIPFMNRDYHNAFYLLLTTVVACCLLYKLRAAAYKKSLPLLTFTANDNGGLFITFYPRGRNQKKREGIKKYRCALLQCGLYAVRGRVPMNLVLFGITWCALCNEAYQPLFVDGLCL